MPRSSEDAPEEEGEAKASSRLAARSMVGEIISGRYRVTELIATGGMSSVYLGQHVHMMKRVAIKVLDPKAEQLPELVARFQREAIAGAHVQHPNIASATDFGQLKDGSYFLVLEYVPGMTLNQLIAKGPLGVQRAVGIVRQLASGLGAAHDVAVIHRDVKPTNVILVEGSNDVVKLIDFGFAQVKLSKMPSLAPPPNEPPAPEKMLTQAGVVLGTVAYMSPEAGLGMSAVDERSDLYALGLILYELLAGKHPFEATEPVQLFLQQRTVPPPPIATRAPGVVVPQALEAVVRKMLEKDPKDRYQKAAEVVSALDTAMMSLAFEMVPDASSLPDSTSLFGSKTDESTKTDEPPAAPPEEKNAIDDSDDKATIYKARPPPELKAAFMGPETIEAGPGAVPKSANPLERVRAMLLRIPGLEALLKKLPQDGRFPPWAYVVLPLVGAFFILLMVLLSRRASRPAGEPARTESVVVAPSAEQALAVPPDKATDVSPDAGGLDAAGWKMTLRNAVREKDWAKGSDAVLTLLRLDPTTFRDHDAANGMRSVAVALEDAGGGPADKFFGALTNDYGSEGLDVLYDIARFRTWTKAGKRATDTLRKPEVMMRASPPLKALFEFREASCTAKRNEFAKLADQGDDRALFEMTSLQNAECRRRRDPCCFNDNRALATAIHALKARLAAPAPSP